MWVPALLLLLLPPGPPGAAPGLPPGQHRLLPGNTTFEQQNRNRLARK